MADAPDRLIGNLPKNAREQFRVQLRTFHSVRSIDLRVFAINADGDVIATAKGVSIRPAQLAAVIELLQQAQTAAVEEGLIHG